MKRTSLLILIAMLARACLRRTANGSFPPDR